MSTRHYIPLPSLLAILTAFFALPLFAQDDLYYDPATDRRTPTVVEDDNATTGADQVTRRHRDPDEYYADDEDEYPYEYSSRIRRFHRPVRVVEYYDPFFTDLWMYDPYYMPGASIYTYGFNDYWTWRRWRRWQRWNSWNTGWGWGMYSQGWNSWGYYNSGWNSWGWNSPWNTPFVVNNYYYDPYWTWNGWNPYCPNVVNNYYNNGWNNNNGNNNGYTPRTYTGTRRHGSVVNPGYARIADEGGRGRLSPDVKGTPVIEKSSRGRVITDREPDVQRNGNANAPSAGRRPINPDKGRTGAAEDRNPNAPTDAAPGRARVPDVGRPSDVNRPGRNNEAPAGRRPNDDRSPSEPRTVRPDDGGRPPRSVRPEANDGPRDVRPSRSDNDDRNSRPARPSYDPRPIRPSNDGGNDARPGRPSSGNDGGRDVRPSRPSYDPAPSRSGGNNGGGGGFSPSRSSGGNNGGSNSGGSSRGGGSSNSSGSRASGGGRGRE